jgi:hypothetical protein
MINFIKSENAFNKILKRGIKHCEDTSILFISPYDKPSQRLLNEVENGNHTLRDPLNVVDSFKTPHAFVACHTTQVPCLVSIRNRRKEIQYYLPLIYERLGISDQ